MTISPYFDHQLLLKQCIQYFVSRSPVKSIFNTTFYKFEKTFISFLSKGFIFRQPHITFLELSWPARIYLHVAFANVYICTIQPYFVNTYLTFLFPLIKTEFCTPLKLS